MRSDVVVLPASMCAAMPMLRILVRSRLPLFLAFCSNTWVSVMARPLSEFSRSSSNAVVKLLLREGANGGDNPESSGRHARKGDRTSRGQAAHTDHKAFGQHEPVTLARSSRGL